MKRLNKIALSVMAVVAVGIGFSGCDDGKSPLMEMQLIMGENWLKVHSRDDDTIINNMTIIGRNGKCNIRKLGAGGNNPFVKSVKYGEKIPYDSYRTVIFDEDSCPPKNGKYEIELNTNFGSYYYEIDRLVL